MTANKTKIPTASGISRLLAAAGFERSKSGATRVKGWRNHSEGFKVSSHEPGRVRVEHKTDSRGANAASRREEMLGEYAGFLTAAGYSAERDDSWALAGLIVTAGKAGQ